MWSKQVGTEHKTSLPQLACCRMLDCLMHASQGKPQRNISPVHAGSSVVLWRAVIALLRDRFVSSKALAGPSLSRPASGSEVQR